MESEIRNLDSRPVVLYLDMLTIFLEMTTDTRPEIDAFTLRKRVTFEHLAQKLKRRY